jgi:hypothetical protein
MTWGKWMIVELSLEEQLEIEKSVRCAMNSTDAQSIAKLCGALIRQNAFQSKLLKQATAHIAQIEMKHLLADQNS